MLKSLYLRLRPVLPALLVLGLGVVALEALHQLTAGIRYRDVAATVRATPASALWLSALFTLFSFIALAGYDASGLRYLDAKVSWKGLALGSFAGYALGNTVGMGPITGGAVRLRVYGAEGLEATQIAKLMAFISSGFGLGITGIGAIGLLWGAPAAATIVPLPVWALRGLALVIFAVLAVVLVACARGRPLRVLRYQIPLPSLGLAAAQLVVSAFDIVFASLALWVLLPASGVDFGSFLAFYALAVAISIISHVPGGIGVFEAVMLLAFKGQLKTEQVAGALLLFRAVYYLAPLGIAVGLLVLREWNALRRGRVREQRSELSPLFLGVAAFFFGTLLLVAAVTPVLDARAARIALPLGVLETAHFLGALAGVGLLLIARGLQLRLRSAWRLAIVLAAASLILAVPQGFTRWESGALAVLVLLLLAARTEFERRAALLALPFNLNGWLLVSAVVAAVSWLGFFAYRELPYDPGLLWRFDFENDAARSLRAGLAVVAAVAVLGVRQLLRPKPRIVERPDPAALELALAVARAQSRPEAALAYAGDKRLLFSTSGRSLLMYARQGGTWAALFDPFGPVHEWPELIWKFVQQARAQGGQPCFYLASAATVPLYLDVGLAAHTLGEHATVRLDRFEADGLPPVALRPPLALAEQEGHAFERVAAGEPALALLPELQEVSQAWLAHRAQRERGYSIARLDARTLAAGPVAVVRREGRIVAFATVLEGGQRPGEPRAAAAVSLLRRRPEAPESTLIFLLVHLLRAYRAEGCQRFGLGMAPLASEGGRGSKRAQHWQRLGRLIYALSDHFDHFEDLRRFKAQFEPEWEPRYLCAEEGLPPLLPFTDIATLVAGELRPEPALG